MTDNNDILKAFKFIVSFLLIISGLILLALLYNFYIDFLTEDLPGKWFFVTIVTCMGLFHIILAIGIILQNKLAYNMFKIYLYISLLAFPIGTIIGYKVIKSIKTYKIDRHFR